jgi:predicted N-acetyltransferase YhbS
MSDYVAIRPALPADAPALAALMEQLGYATSAAEMRDRLRVIRAQDLYHTLVAEREGRIVGMLGVRVGLWYERNGYYGQIAALVVDQACRHQGIGTALMRAAEQWLHNRGVHVVILFSGAARAAAHAFYERLGYHEATAERFLVRVIEETGQNGRGTPA